VNRFVVDTNVAVVANGRSDENGGRIPSIDCRFAAVEFLLELMETGTVLLDLAHEIQSEYRNQLRPSGQPGVGDQFYRTVLNSAPNRIERIDLPKGEDGEYSDLPRSLIKANFDRSDRKFAALAKRTNAAVANATDSDWVIHHKTIIATGIQVKFICGFDRDRWFE
jgi:hypothetical protein